MAKMTVEFDTESKSFSAAIDGVSVPNARAAEVYPSYEKDDEYRCMFLTSSKDESTGISEVRRLFASESKAAKAALARNDGSARASAEFPGFVEVAERDASKVVGHVAAAFGCK